MYKLELKLKSINIDFELRSKKTIINDNSASGKTYLFNLIHKEYSGSDILLLNYHGVEIPAKAKIICNGLKSFQNKIVIVDQASEVFNQCEKLQDIVSTDLNNHYILMGRSLDVIANASDLAELHIENKRATINYLFPLPL